MGHKPGLWETLALVVLQLGYGALFAGWLVLEIRVAVSDVFALVRQTRGRRREESSEHPGSLLPLVPLTPPARRRMLATCESSRNLVGEGKIMRLRFLGTDSDRAGCPAMYATDRGTYAVQGKLITDPQALGDAANEVAMAPDEAIVEFDPALARYLIEHFREHHEQG